MTKQAACDSATDRAQPGGLALLGDWRDGFDRADISVDGDSLLPASKVARLGMGRMRNRTDVRPSDGLSSRLDRAQSGQHIGRCCSLGYRRWHRDSIVAVGLRQDARHRGHADQADENHGASCGREERMQAIRLLARVFHLNLRRSIALFLEASVGYGCRRGGIRL
ncbi:hypothetical protein AWV79_17545 [Cupriavidus sp. UYMMa02A]|nr:hypothetical protein AWV79_17545 [Cupriavidus sp. UYMMa02A]